MTYITYDNRASERLEALRMQAITNRAISNALNRNRLYIPSKPPKRNLRASDIAFACFLGVLIGLSFVAAYAASYALGDFVGPAVAMIGGGL